MREPPSFASLVFALLGVLLFAWAGRALLRVRRRRPSGATPTNTEPHCPRCDYLLVGLPSAGHCPECGTFVDDQNVARGERPRYPRAWLTAGLLAWAVAAGLLALSVQLTRDIIAGINWYHFRPTAKVMEDLRTGTGRRPPPYVRTPVTMAIFSHGWVRERIDLARVALEELKHRDKAGNLPAAYRDQLVDLGLAVQDA